MSFSYNIIIDNSKNKDVQLNNKMNDIILDANSGRKKSSQEDIDNMMEKLLNKIFDVVEINKVNYFLDKELNSILDDNTNIVGFINMSSFVSSETSDYDKNKYIFYADVDKVVNQMKMDEIEFNQLTKTIGYIN